MPTAGRCERESWIAWMDVDYPIRIWGISIPVNVSGYLQYRELAQRRSRTNQQSRVKANGFFASAGYTLAKFSLRIFASDKGIFSPSVPCESTVRGVEIWRETEPSEVGR